VTMAAIRTEIIARIEAIAPSAMADVAFLPYVDDSAISDDLRTWAQANPGACLRRFDVEALGDTDEVAVSWVTAERVTESAEIVVAYPRDNRFGDLAALFDAIATDLAAIDEYAGTRGFSVDPIAAANSAAIVTEAPTREAGEGVFFGVIPLRVTYWRFPP
jgi:hypothetical protein